MGLFFPSASKKPSASSIAEGEEGHRPSLHKYDRNSRGKILPRELPLIHRRLVGKLGRAKAERVMEQLQANMDTDGAFGTKNVSSKEIDTLMRTLEKSDHSNLDIQDLNKTREILEGYE